MVQKLVHLYNFYNANFRAPGQPNISYGIQPVIEQVMLIGDSLTWQNNNPGPPGITTTLVNQGWGAGNVKVDGLVGRSIINGVAPYIPSTQDVINSQRALGYNPRTWCFSLITNDEWDTDAGWTAKVNTVLDLVKSVPHSSGLKYRIFWIGGPTYRPDIQAGAPYNTRFSRFQTVMDTIAASRVPADFEFISTINICALIHNGRDETGLWLDSGSDVTGRHMTTAGYTLRNSLSIPYILPPTQNILTEDGLPILTEAGDPIYA